MSPVQLVFKFLSAVTSVYMLMLIFRVLLSWFQGRMNGRGVEILMTLTDPYLNKFKGISWLRFGFLDLSPVVAISILGMLSQVFNAIAISGSITPMLILVILIQAVWEFFSFFLSFLTLMMVFRLVTLLFFSTWNHQILFQVDNILYKVVARILGVFTTKNVKYVRALIICILILIVIRVGVSVGLSYLMKFLYTL